MSNFFINRKECFIENKNKTKTFYDWKPSKYGNIDPQQNLTGSYKKILYHSLPRNATLQNKTKSAKKFLHMLAHADK